MYSFLLLLFALFVVLELRSLKTSVLGCRSADPECERGARRRPLKSFEVLRALHASLLLLLVVFVRLRKIRLRKIRLRKSGEVLGNLRLWKSSAFWQSSIHFDLLSSLNSSSLLLPESSPLPSCSIRLSVFSLLRLALAPSASLSVSPLGLALVSRGARDATSACIYICARNIRFEPSVHHYSSRPFG